MTPAGPFKLGPHQQQIPVAIGERCVVPGDAMVGDTDGVVFIPLERLRDTVEAAGKVQADEVLKQAANPARIEEASSGSR